MSLQYWDNRFADRERLLYGERPNDFLKAQARFLAPRSRVLCLGDGEARNGVWLASKGHDVVSLDFSTVAQAKGRALAVNRGVDIEFWCIDFAQWVHLADPGHPWDAVISIFVHLPPSLARSVAETATRQTRPGGTLILEAFTPAQPGLATGGPKDPDVLVTREGVRACWSGWNLDARIVERRIFEGSAHQGLSSVVQGLGRRLGCKSLG